MNLAFSIVLLFTLLDCVTNESSLALKGCHVPLTAFYRAVKALFWTGKMGFTHWDWDLATGNGMNNYKMGTGFLFFSSLCSNILK